MARYGAPLSNHRIESLLFVPSSSRTRIFLDSDQLETLKQSNYFFFVRGIGIRFPSRFDKVFESISLHGKNGWPFRKRYTGNKISGMRCTSSNVLSLLSSSVLSNGVRFSPVSSYEAKDRDSIAERRCVNAAIPRTNHNPIITLISALSAMGLRYPNQPSYSTHFVHGTMIISFRFDPFSIGKVFARSTPRFSAHNFM